MSWHGLLGIYQAAQAEYDQQLSSPPAACPHDGEPLVTGPDGELTCPYDGWKAGASNQINYLAT